MLPRSDYLAAVFRWSKGAVQLSWTSFYAPLHGYLWPWVVLLFVVGPIGATVAYFQMVRFDDCHRTKNSKWLWDMATSSFVEPPCHQGPTLGILSDPVFVLYALYMCGVALASFKNPRVGALLIMFENITYFFSSQTAYFWIAIPMYMCLAPNGAPLSYDAVTLTLGGLWVELHMSQIYAHIKSWAPLEHGKEPEKLSLLRAQQMFFVTAPLHTLAIFQGTEDGWKIIFRAKDASRWASFDSINAITTAKVWVLAMNGGFIVAIVVGVARVIASRNDMANNAERLLGIVMSFVFLSLNALPSLAMFFHKAATEAKKKPSVIDRCTKAIFGKASVITPSMFYTFLYTAAIVAALSGIGNNGTSVKAGL